MKTATYTSSTHGPRRWALRLGSAARTGLLLAALLAWTAQASAVWAQGNDEQEADDDGDASYELFESKIKDNSDVLPNTGGGGTCPNPITINFEGLNEGAGTSQINSQTPGVTFSTDRSTGLMIFDSACPGGCSGQDPDLGTPNQIYGGPGIGSGGASNQQPRGKILIISEDGNSSDPDDHASGGTITLNFDNYVDLIRVRFLDMDDGSTSAAMKAFRDGTQVGSTRNVGAAGNNSYQSVSFSRSDVNKLEIYLKSSGAVPSIKYCPRPTTTDPELRLGITNLLSEPPGGWCPPGPPECVPINFSVAICNNDRDGASSPGGNCNNGGSLWPNAVEYEGVRAQLQLSPRLVYANAIDCDLDTDGDGQFDDGTCSSFSITDNGGGSLTLNYPDLPVGQGAQITFDATVTGDGDETIQVLSEVSKSGLPPGVPDADATPDNCNLVTGPPFQDDCDQISFAVQPVEMTLFEADLNGRSTLLRWETASETNNPGFEVQHRPAEAESFNTLGFVEGMGTTLEAQRYSFAIDDLAPGRHVFRLKQVDYDGTFEYSPQIEVSVGMPEAFLVSKAYPNPFNPQASLSFGVKVEQEVRVELFNMLGQRVKVLYLGRPAAGTTKTIQIDGSDLRSGVYVLRVQGERFVDTQTITLVK